MANRTIVEYVVLLALAGALVAAVDILGRGVVYRALAPTIQAPPLP